MQNDVNKDAPTFKCPKEFKSINSKIITVSSYLIAMRTESMREYKKSEDILKTLVKLAHDIRGGLWGCLITVWFVAILVIYKNF